MGRKKKTMMKRRECPHYSQGDCISRVRRSELFDPNGRKDPITCYFSLKSNVIWCPWLKQKKRGKKHETK